MASDGADAGEIDPRWFAQIAERTLDGLVIVEAVPDGDGRIVDFVFRYSNRQAVELLRRSRAELIGRSMVEVFGGDQADAVRHVRSAAAEVRRMVDQLLDLADDLASEPS